MAYFIGLSMMRTIALRDSTLKHKASLETPDGAIAFIEREFAFLSKSFGEDKVRDFMGQVRERGKGLTMAKNFHLKYLLQRADVWGVKIASMSWNIWRAKPPVFFVTSDNPAFARIPKRPLTPGLVGIDKDDLGVELGFPLSSRAFLIAKWGGAPFYEVSCPKSRARELNRRTVLSAHEYVFSPENDSQIRSLVVEHKNFRVEYPPYS